MPAMRSPVKKMMSLRSPRHESPAMSHKMRGRMRLSSLLRDSLQYGPMHITYSTVNAVATLVSVAQYIQGCEPRGCFLGGHREKAL